MPIKRRERVAPRRGPDIHDLPLSNKKASEDWGSKEQEQEGHRSGPTWRARRGYRAPPTFLSSTPLTPAMCRKRASMLEMVCPEGER